MKLFVLAGLLTLLYTTAVDAQTRVDFSFNARAEARAFITTPLASVQQGGRDSLKNGAIIGAVVGGAAMFGIAVTICTAFRAEGEPSCFPPALGIGALGAGIGAAAGAGIDALLARRPAVRVSIRF